MWFLTRWDSSTPTWIIYSGLSLPFYFSARFAQIFYSFGMILEIHSSSCARFLLSSYFSLPLRFSCFKDHSVGLKTSQILAQRTTASWCFWQTLTSLTLCCCHTTETPGTRYTFYYLWSVGFSFFRTFPLFFLFLKELFFHCAYKFII